ncbi:MAG: EthD family reductase [Caulobacterales bacterium]
MYAIVGVLKRPDHWSREKFRTWWLEEHAEIAKKLPGLRRYTVHPPAHAFNPVSGALDGEPSHDGLAFLWFDDKAAAEAAFASPEGEHDRVTFGKTGVSVIIFGVEGSREMLG